MRQCETTIDGQKVLSWQRWRSAACGAQHKMRQQLYMKGGCALAEMAKVLHTIQLCVAYMAKGQGETACINARGCGEFEFRLSVNVPHSMTCVRILYCACQKRYYQLPDIKHEKGPYLNEGTSNRMVGSMRGMESASISNTCKWAGSNAGRARKLCVKLMWYGGFLCAWTVFVKKYDADSAYILHPLMHKQQYLWLAGRH
jgi:hypothetical protein